MKKPLSRQRLWQIRKQKAGLCKNCGHEKALPGATLGKKCGREAKLRNRRRNGHKPWRKGKAGRPAIY